MTEDLLTELKRWAHSAAHKTLIWDSDGLREMIASCESSHVGAIKLLMIQCIRFLHEHQRYDDIMAIEIVFSDDKKPH